MSKVRTVIALLPSALGTVALLLLSLAIDQQHQQKLALFFIYQGCSLLISLTVILTTRLAKGTQLRYLRIGDLKAPTNPSKLLGIKATDNWMPVGLTFAALISIATAAYLLIYNWGALATVQLQTWLLAAVLSLPLSALNAFNEEIVSRWAVVEALSGRLARFAPWVSAAIFGTVHFFGTPGGLLGSLMAGFLAWFLARSIQETRGIGWAWIIHFLQDVMILTVMIALFI